MMELSEITKAICNAIIERFKGHGIYCDTHYKLMFSGIIVVSKSKHKILDVFVYEDATIALFIPGSRPGSREIMFNMGDPNFTMELFLDHVSKLLKSYHHIA